MLANAIYELGASDQAAATPATSPYEPTTTKELTYSPPTSESITAAFEEYRAHRFPEAKHLYEYSQFVSRLVHGQVKNLRYSFFCSVFSFPQLIQSKNSTMVSFFSLSFFRYLDLV